LDNRELCGVFLTPATFCDPAVFGFMELSVVC
jgi:hypothetical protein